MPDLNQFIHYKIFAPHNKTVAFTTTKNTFREKYPRFTGDSESVYSQNRKLLAEALNIREGQLVFPRQTHTNCVAVVSEKPSSELTEVDAIVTGQTGICLCIQTADCVPILLYDPERKAIAAVHAGWRGTVSLIASRAVAKMENEFGVAPQNILASIGPSISPEVYEVGNEVIKAAKENVPAPEKSIVNKPGVKFHFNLWESNRQILISAGLNPQNIEISGECSYTDSRQYFSARRDGTSTGRMVSGIMMI